MHFILKLLGFFHFVQHVREHIMVEIGLQHFERILGSHGSKFAKFKRLHGEVSPSDLLSPC